MFGRRRHAAAVPAAPVPQLTDAQILEIVHGKVAELIGENGESRAGAPVDLATRLGACVAAKPDF